MSHVRRLADFKIPNASEKVGRKLANALKKEKAIMGIFDEGCMGMYNAIVPDELLHPTGIFQRAAQPVFTLCKNAHGHGRRSARGLRLVSRKGLKFHFGENEETDLTEAQVLQQCKMYIAAVRIADEFGCATIGIQYQQGLKDLCPASDLVEGTLNNVDRPPVFREGTREELYKGQALPHFNEVDECAGIDGLVTDRLWRQLGFSPENTLHDLRWGRQFTGKVDGKKLDAYVWVFLISGAAPPEHFIGGWKGADSMRQPPMYWRLGGGTLRGISKPGWIVWSRVDVSGGRLNFDTGLAEVVKLPAEETEERWRLTTPEWPIMHAVLQGITRDQMMGRHKANHIQVAYAPDKAAARRALFAKAAAMDELGINVSVCGEI